MKGTILITDSLFISSEHEELLRAAGYEIERLDKPKATEDELVAVIKGKIGYILGGTEEVTEKVIDAADELKVIVFTGIGYKSFIPAWEYAEQKGIKVLNTPDSPTQAVAEWALAMALAMNRGVFELSRTGAAKFKTMPGIEGQHVGIIGLGRIGSRIVDMIQPFRPASVSYWNRTHREEVEGGYKEIPNLFAESDIIFLCVSKDAGEGFIGVKELSRMKDGALLVSFAHPGLIDELALLHELQARRIRAVSDDPAKNPAFAELPLMHWQSFNASNAFNTQPEIKLTSDTAVQVLLAHLG